MFPLEHSPILLTDLKLEHSTIFLDLHLATIGLDIQILNFLRVAVLDMFYCKRHAETLSVQSATKAISI